MRLTSPALFTLPLLLAIAIAGTPGNAPAQSSGARKSAQPTATRPSISPGARSSLQRAPRAATQPTPAAPPQSTPTTAPVQPAVRPPAQPAALSSQQTATLPLSDTEAIKRMLETRKLFRTPESPLFKPYIGPEFTPGQAPQTISLDVSAVDNLFLQLNGPDDARGIWAEPELVDAGGKRTRLTDMEPVLSRNKSNWMEIQKNGPIEIGKTRYTNGIRAKTDTLLVYPLGRKYKRFECKTVLASRETASSKLRFEIYSALPTQQSKLIARHLPDSSGTITKGLPGFDWNKWCLASDTTLENDFIKRTLKNLEPMKPAARAQLLPPAPTTPPDSPAWLERCLETQRRLQAINDTKGTLAALNKDSAAILMNKATEESFAKKKKTIETALPDTFSDDTSKIFAQRDALAFTGKIATKLALAFRTLEYVQKTTPLPDLETKVKEFSQKYALATLDTPAMLAEITLLRRQILFSHPALQFDKLLINKNPPTTYSHNCDQYLGRHSRVGDGLTVLENWKADTPKETLLLKGKMPAGAYNKPYLSFDGRRIVFAFADHTPREQDLHRFFLYEAASDGSSVRQLTGGPSDKLLTWDNRRSVLVEDNDPSYLPDGGIIFVSTRSQNFGRCHGGRYTPSLLLYRCDGNGDNIRQISWGEANENDPTVLNDGRVIFTRWEYVDRHEMEFHKLWTTRADGTNLMHFYGNDTIYPLMIAESKPIPGSHSVISVGMAHHSFTNGTLIKINPDKGENGPDPITRITPEIAYPESDEPYTGNGSYATPYPVNEDLFFAAYSNTHVPMQGNSVSANSFSIYLVDTMGGREPIYKDPNFACFSPTPLIVRTPPPTHPSMVDLKLTSGSGIYYVDNVNLTRNDPDKIIKNGEIKYLRFNELINKPAAHSAPISHDVPNALPKRILGTVPVDENGGVAVRVPACTPLQIQALDKNGMAIMTERSLHYLQPGEVRGCVGCHETSGAPPSMIRYANSKLVPQELTPPAGPRYDGGLSFPRTVQPVLDRYCISCHGLDKKSAKNINLLGEPDVHFTRSYMALLKYTKTIGNKPSSHGLQKNISRPKDYYAHASKIPSMLMNNHGGVKMDKDSFARIIDWLDVNAQEYGDYSKNREEDRKPNPAGEKALRDFIRLKFGDAAASAPYSALVNVGQPDESRILKAPLAIEAGGWAQIPNGWKTTKDPDYLKMAKLVADSITPLKRQDVAGTCGSHVYGGNCNCGGCWIPKAEENYLKSRSLKTAAR